MIQPDGEIMLPYIGSVQAAGKTPPELLEEIRERLKNVFTGPATPHISLNVYPSRVVQVLGFVFRPGQFPLTHTMRATDALALAGGVRPAFADPDGSVLIRRNGKNQKTHNVYFNAILESGDGRTNYVVEPGDIIYVPATPFRKAAFFVEDVLSPLHALIAPITAPVTAVIGL
jgi:polysaccharide export outer membrane protein